MTQRRAKPVPFHRGRLISGSYEELLAGPPQFYADVAWKYGGIARFRVFHREVYAVAHPVYVHRMLVTEQALYPKSPMYKNAEQMLGEGLVTLEGDAWACDRKIILPALHKHAIAGMVDTVNLACDDVLNMWARDADMYQPVVPDVRRIGLQVISESLMGTSLEATQSARFSESLMEASHLLTRKNWSLLQFPEYVPTRINRRLRAVRHDMLRFMAQQVARRQEEGIGERGDLLDMMLIALDADEPGITRDRVLSEMLTLFSAGYDTTSSAIAWAIYYLSQHPALQRRLQEEVHAVLGDRQPQWTDLTDLTYTGHVFDEAMRLNPPVHSIPRTNTEEDVLGEYRIPAGSLLMVSINGVNRSPLHWDDPGAFRPDRFGAGRSERFDARAFIPFSAGQRRCIGPLFATVEAKIVLARIAQRFSFDLDPGKSVQSASSAAQYPEGLFVRFKPREGAMI